MGDLRAVRWVVSVLTLVAVLGATLVLDISRASPAVASVPPVVDAPDELVTTDPLPTVQINGVVWDQHILGNTVYVVGSFTTARPAGSPPGVNQVARQNMLAYDLTTGQLIPGFVANLNNQGMTVTSSPDGSRIYVGGLFTQVNGVNRYRIAALDPTTGAVIPGFNASVDYLVNDLVVTDSVVYAGGQFGFASGGQPRSRLAAFSVTNGALLDWAPSADDRVQTLALSPDGSRMFIGGMFQNLNGQAARGVAPVDAVTGELIPWPANQVVQVGNPNNGAIFDLRIDGDWIYGGGYTFGRTGGNLEGIFKAHTVTGVIQWIEDCHGDTYQILPMDGLVYKSAHVHFCGNLGGWVQTSNEDTQWGDHMRHAMAFRDVPAGTMRRDQWTYDNWEGFPAPSVAHWFPDWQIGDYTGQNQATWAVDGSGDYVVYGGEFLRVNGIPQQGLVRFAKRSIAPANDGPRVSGDGFPINVISPAAGYARVSFTANFDRDNANLNYRITRNGVDVHTTTIASNFWDRPTVSFLDSGLTPGQTYTYRVWATDPDGNQAPSNNTPVTIATSGSLSPYAEQVVSDDARIYWRLGEQPGASTAQDSAGGTKVGTVNDMTFGRPGAIIGDSDTAASPNSTSSRIVSPPHVTGGGTEERNPVYDELTVEAWFRTTSTAGGRLVGFGNNATTGSGSTTHDRMLYVANDGRVLFGVRTRPEGSGVTSARQRRTVASAPGLNDGQWHHVVGTLSPEGMRLYVDGVRVASRADVNSGHGYYGYWRVGADTITSGSSGWTAAPSSTRLNGDIDEVAIYHRALTAPQIARHFELSGRDPALAPRPDDPYGQSVYDLDPFLYYRLDEPSGTVANDRGIRVHTGDYAGSTTRSQPGVIDGNGAVGFNGGGSVSARAAVNSPNVYSVEAWFNTTSTTGGKIVGFGSSRTALSANADRHVYMRDDGRLAFGVGGAEPVELITEDAYNDGEWHHVVASQGPGGMRLFVDGVLQGSDPLQVAASYVGYWRVGGDVTPIGSTANYFAGLIDEVAVYDHVLPPAQVAQHYALVASDGNLSPVAAFSWVADELAVSFDGSGSSDPDGSIVSYEWDFGDGGVGSGVSPDHTYAEGGTYTVMLTVTDDEGATGSVSHSVTVTEDPGNLSPVAAFSWVADELAVSFDGSGSSDPDGSIVSYEWDFGDGGVGSGVSPDHTYAEGGTYTVMLTVTDDEGATGSVSESVTVSAAGEPVVFAADAFERAVTNGLGAADVGGSWTTLGSPTHYSVVGGQGRHRMHVPGATTQSYLNGVAAQDVLASVDLSFDSAPTGGGVYSAVAVRRVGTSDYRAQVRVMPTGTSLTLFRIVDGGATSLGGVGVPGLVYNDGDVLRLQVSAVGSGSTELAAKVWKVGEAEPDWQVTATDTTASLQGSGGVGLSNYLAGSATVSPVFALYDNLLARSPGPAPDPGNLSPVAAFSWVADELAVSFDGSGSSDPDGSIVSYEWDFGDGGVGSGVSPDHTYAEGGTYTVMLTVTDDEGATGSVSHSVTVTEDPGNLSPVAAFSWVADELAVSFDGSGSSDPDGSIVSYEWDFGDGGVGSGVSPDHTYAEGGTYTVMLTVTDDEGATGSVSESVTVSAAGEPVVFAADAFERAVTNGLGAADVGGSWTTLGSPTHYSVVGGQGRHRMHVPGATTQSYLNGVAAQDVLASVDLSFDSAPTGGGVYSAVAVRRVGTSDYRAQVRVMPTGTSLTLFRIVDGGATSLGGVGVPGLVYNDGDVLRLQVSAVGSGSTELAAKVWKVGEAEPDWQVTATDTTASLQGSGGVGLSNYLAGSATVSPVFALYDNLLARSPGPAPDPGNLSPVAAFSWVADELAVSFDGSGSSDPDGSIVSYEWDFGDGGVGSGVSPDHTYAEGGTYTVMLTVTDDEGATGSVSESVTVSAAGEPVVFAADAFERAVTNGLGAADVGGSWTTLGSPTHYSVVGGQGRHRMHVPGATTQSYLNGVAAQDVLASVDLSFDSAPTGGGVYSAVAVRRVGTSDYRAQVRVMPTGTSLTLFRIVDGGATSLGGVGVPGLVYNDGDVLRLQVSAVGSGSTELAAKVWKVGEAEPDWQVTATDTTASLQGSGGVGLSNYLAGSATVSPVFALYDNLLARSFAG
jgi:PKD repeat protein